MEENKKFVYDYINKVSNNKKVQEIIVSIVGKILLSQINVEYFVKENENRINHIRDWIISIVENNEKWKTPRVLTIDALNNAADKYFEKKNNKLQTIELDEKHEKLIADLGDYYIVQMLTSEALDNESKVMQHCIGHGGYDRNLKKKYYQYLSLRDKYNKAHATLEIYENKVLQLQGKQNYRPDKKYLEKLLPWLIGNNYKDIPWKSIGKYFEEGKWVDFEYIPIKENVDYKIIKDIEGFQIINIFSERMIAFAQKTDEWCDSINGFLLVNENKILDDFVVLRNYINKDKKENIYRKVIQYLVENKYQNIPYEKFETIYNCRDKKIYSIYKLPDILTINSNINLERADITKLSKKITIKGDLDLSFSKIKTLPIDTNIKGKLDLSFSHIQRLPDNLTVKGSLNLRNCIFLDNLPNKLNIGKDLNLCDIKLENLYNNIIEIGGELSIAWSKIKVLPKVLKCKTIFIDEGQVNLIKEDMIFDEIIMGEDYYVFSRESFFEFKKDCYGEKYLKK